MSELRQKECIPCQGGVPPLPLSEKKKFMDQIDDNWSLKNDHTQLWRELKFKDYKKPWQLVNKISEVAEAQWHHPEISFGWGHLEIGIWTHKLNNLVESDFIFAAKVDNILQGE